MAMEINMPEHVDSLPQMLWWESDEVGAAFCIFAIGILTHYTMTSIFILIPVMSFLRKMKNDGLNGTAFHAFCSTGLVMLNKEFPDLLEKDLFI